MSSNTFNRKQFLTLTAASVAGASFLQGCSSDDPVTPPTTAGAGGSGTAGSGTAGTGTAGTGTGGTGTAGSGTSGSSSGGKAGSGGMGGSGGASGGSGGASGGSGGKAGSGGTGGGGGASGGSGGKAGSGGTGGSGGGMCGTANIVHTSNNTHTHIPGDSAQLKMSLKTLINGTMSTMEFTLPDDGGHVHKITLTAQQVTTLKGGGMVPGVESTTDGGHKHTYTLSCGA